MTIVQEMPIPSMRRGETIFLYSFTAIAIFFIILSVVDLLKQEAVIAPVLWLGVVAFGIWDEIRRAGGCRRFVIKVMGAIAGKKFVEISPPSDQPTEIGFGFQLFGHRRVQRRISLDKVESVEWGPGQGGKYWNVCLWFKHDHPTERSPWKPGQYVHIVGPARRKEDTEVLGLSFVEFLRCAGVPLVRGEKDTCFVRSGIPNGINQEHLATT